MHELAEDLLTSTRSIVARSGRQLHLAAAGYEATITSVGASLRRLRHGDRDLIVPFDADEVRPDCRGALLAPWPGRVIDGHYRFRGEEFRLALNESARGHALHGLLSWSEFEDRSVESSCAVLAAVLEPQEGYPFRIEVETEYRVTKDGLFQTVTATNLGAAPAPWGTGTHPYLVAGPGRVDDWMLELPANVVLTATPDRLIPLTQERVDAHPDWDFRIARPIGTTQLDHTFTNLTRADDIAEVRLRTASGTGVAMSWDSRCPWVQVYTADNPPTTRRGLAVEPMTCPPNAFNSGTDLVGLEPGESHSAGWSIRAL